jgi:hypothetical protein
MLETSDSLLGAVSRSFVAQCSIIVCVFSKRVSSKIFLAIDSVGHLKYVQVVLGHKRFVSSIRPFESQSITVSLSHIFV